MHHNLWKFLNLIMVGVVLVGLIGCTAPVAPAATAPEAAPPAVAAGLDACQGQSLVLGSMTDQYVAAFRVLVPKFEEASGAKVTLDELGYVDLYQKLIADFVGHTGNYDLMTVDIVWSGEFGQNLYTLPLDDFMARDEAELQLDDILPVAWTLGEWQGTHVAYPLAGYANVLNYRKDLLEQAGIQPPTTQEELTAAAQALTNADAGVYGIALLGAKGPAVAQDYMAWVQQYGGRLLDDEGNPTLNTPENVEILQHFGDLFSYAPAGAMDYWWDQRETAFRSGNVALMEGWSIARAGYENPDISSVAGNVDLTVAPVKAGMEPQFGFGGWGIGINADSTPEQQECAWQFIKWVTSPEIQKEWLRNDGAPIRRSTMTDPEIVAEYPWMPILLESFEKGDGDYRPRIPQYSIIQDALGTHVNAFLVGQETAEQALEAAQKQVEDNWQ
ncbi:extracellular solute-binding protein [Caldilinea sp.]|uniref:extracellular solute-binding protein n=1 Tax=Caldilinea sp. TaxID=2293560 RepID=UPI002B545F9D|nr:extracellular solute-binding protein [Anaerolineales bacterium]HQY92087.1 extracellular solute-binding protein [Caldilinea sp.]